MEILVAKHAGFCFGVKRAIDIAEQVAEKHQDKTYVYGQLVHNERVISELQQKGIHFVETIEQIPDEAITVLRAHGEPGTTYQKLEKKSISKNNTLFDATCPLVTLVHNVAVKLKNNGYEVLLFGKRNHPEGIGIGYHLKGEETFFIEKTEDAVHAVEYIKKNNFPKVAIISQTTMSVDGYRQLMQTINHEMKQQFKEMHLSMQSLQEPYVYVDTICNPTKQRQIDTEEIAKKADVMIVIGGKNSSNTKELVAKSKSFGVETYFVQDAEQIEKAWLAEKNTIGISAGASTPDSTIQEVVSKVKALGKEHGL